MLAAGDPAEHLACVGGVARLAEELAVDHHHRVRRQHDLARVASRRRLFPGEAEHGRLRLLVSSRGLVEVDGAHGEAEAEAAQQLAAAGGGGGEDEGGEGAQG